MRLGMGHTHHLSCEARLHGCGFRIPPRLRASAINGHDHRMKFGVAAVATVALAFVLLWLRERRARTVFPASQAASLMNPLRRYIQPPDRMVAEFGIAGGDTVLELGPGPGYFTVEAARAAGAGGRIICIDLQPDMVRELMRRLPDDLAPRVRLVIADAMHLPLSDAAVDRAFAVAVLGEVPQPPRALAELRRVVRAGGTVSIAETLTDPDYIRQGTLREMGWEVGLSFVVRHRGRLGYIMRFTRPA